MSGERILSDDQISEMAGMREAGSSYPAIARHFEQRGIVISRSAIQAQCLRVGADSPPQRRQNRAARIEPFKRGDCVVRPFSETDDDLLRQLDMQGKSLAEIGKQTGRARSSVRHRLMALARRDSRAEDGSDMAALHALSARSVVRWFQSQRSNPNDGEIIAIHRPKERTLMIVAGEDRLEIPDAKAKALADAIYGALKTTVDCAAV